MNQNLTSEIEKRLKTLYQNPFEFYKLLNYIQWKLNQKTFHLKQY
jgi:hypothetical protein